jgi:hypothetical protein
MINTSYILKLTSERDISLPNNGVALLTALDQALEDNSFEIIYKGNYDAKVALPEQKSGEFATFIVFELDGNADLPQVVEKIKELASYACSPEVIESTQGYQLVSIDSCPLDFKY